MNPQATLEAMALLRDRLSTPEYQSYMTGFMEDTYRKQNGPVYVDNKTSEPSGYGFCLNEIRRIDMAEAYFVTRDMTPLVRWAAAGLDDLDRFDHDLWPTDYGFVLYEQGPTSVEMWGRTVVTSAMTWGRVVSDGQAGTLVNLYTDARDPRDQVTFELLAGANSRSVVHAMGNLHLTGTYWIADGQRVGPPSQTPRADYLKWAIDGMQTLATDATNETRFILAYLMMLGQTVTSVTEHEMDRRTAKRFGRMRLPKRVTVVELRRHAGVRSEGESTVEWAHRWICRGHWRRQAYKGDDGQVVTRKIWIHAYMKNTDRPDLPLIQSTKVYNLMR